MVSYAAIESRGMTEKDTHQLLYEIVYASINTGASSSSDYTVGIQNVAGTWSGAGRNVSPKLLPNGRTMNHLVQILYEAVVALIANDAIAETEWTGRIFNAIGSGTLGTFTGGTTSRLYILIYNGVAQGHLAEMLYEIVDAMISDATYTSANFTLDVKSDTINPSTGVPYMAGVSG